MTAPDLYAALDVPRDADAAAVHAAYRQAAKSAHPDVGGAPERWALVSLARDVLTDPDRRARYDRTGEAEAAEPDNSVALALGMLSGCLDEMLLGFGGNRRILQGDLVAALRRKLDEHAQKRHREEVELQHAIDVNRWFLGRFKAVKDDAPNLMQRMVEGRIAEFEQRRRNAARALRIIKDADGLLAGYVFQVEAPPQSVYGSQVWPAFGTMQQTTRTWV